MPRVLIAALLGLFALLPPSGPAAAQGQRVAVAVGVGAYRNAPALPNPPNDARDIAAALARLGFETELVLDPDRAALEGAVRRLGTRARGAEAALFYFAGHALEVGGRNWVLPAPADIRSDRDLRFEGLDLDSVLEQLEGAARLSIVLLDACRDNPFRLRLGAGTRGGGAAGLAPLRAAVGTLVAFATAPGTVAEDGSGRNSPFTAALLRRIETPGLELRLLMAEVRREVREATAGRQVPWEHSSLEGQFFFRPAAALAGPAGAAGPPLAQAGPPAAGRTASAEIEMLFWESARSSGNPADLRAYLERFPDGVFAPLARNRLAQPGTAPAAAGGPARPPGPPSSPGTAPSVVAAAPAGGTTPPTAANTPTATTAAARPAAPSPDATSPPPAAATPPPAAATPPPASTASPATSRPPAAPGAPAPAPAPAAAAPPPLTAERLAALLPSRAREQALGIAARYLEARSPKALVAHPQGASWRNSAEESPAAAEERALESCQVYVGRPCAVVAVNEDLRPPAAGQEAPRREMPRVAHAGAFDPAQVPTLTPARRRAAIVQGYAAAAEPKAMALHPWGRVFVATGAASQRAAEEQALAACNADPDRNGRDGPCYLYAVGNRVVLPERRRAPLAPAAAAPARPAALGR